MKPKPKRPVRKRKLECHECPKIISRWLNLYGRTLIERDKALTSLAEADKRILQERNSYLEGTLDEYKQYLRNFGKLRDESQVMLDAVCRALEQVQYGYETMHTSREINIELGDRWRAERDALASKVQELERMRSPATVFQMLQEPENLAMMRDYLDKVPPSQRGAKAGNGAEAERMGEVASKKLNFILRCWYWFYGSPDVQYSESKDSKLGRL